MTNFVRWIQKGINDEIPMVSIAVYVYHFGGMFCFIHDLSRGWDNNRTFMQF